MSDDVGNPEMDQDNDERTGGRIITFPQALTIAHDSPCKVVSCHPPGNKEIFRRTIRVIGGREGIFSIMRRFNNLYCASIALAGYFTDVLPSSIEPEKSLYSVCVHSGLNAWYAAERMQEPELMCYKEYLRGLLKQVHQVMEWDVYIDTNDRREYWNCADRSCADWWREFKGVPIVTRRLPTPSPPSTASPNILTKKDYRTIIAVEILREEAITVIDGGLDAIVS